MYSNREPEIDDEEEKENKRMKRVVFGSIVGFIALLALILSVVFIPAGNVGVITRFGAVNRVAYSGVSWKVPFIEGAHRMSIRTQKDEVDASAASFNLQTVNSKIAVNYHLDGKFAAQVYNEVGRNYQELVLAPAIQNAFKAVTARYTAEQLIQSRESVSGDATNELQNQVEKYHIVIESFNIVNFDFSPEYNAAIEAKQVAEQQVSTAKQTLQKAQVEAEMARQVAKGIADSAVISAQGQADAQAALKKTGALTEEYLRYLFLTNWDGKLPAVMGSATPIFDVSNFIPPIADKTK